MTCRSTYAFCVVALLIPPAVTPARANDEVKFWSVRELDTSDVDPSVVGGTVADPKDWPASFYSKHGEARCTSTLVGPRALLTAAHCVGEATTRLVYEGKTYKATCQIPKEYQSGGGDPSTADWALCQVETPIKVEFESIRLDPAGIAVGGRVLLAGFGCTKRNMTGGNNGVLATGETAIERLPQKGDNDIVTKSKRDDPALCPGDSGGGAYQVERGNKLQRVIIAVNSRTDVLNGEVVGTSYLSSLSSLAGAAFVKGWMKATGEPICGVTPGMKSCRRVP
jgi:hypothetical protein